ncbi:MAG: MipA/OmpV family protein [Hyphomicrobiaceae bacterium]
MAICRLITAASCAGVLLAGLSLQASATDVRVGGIGIVKPTYEGSDSYEVIGAPIAYPVFASTSNNTFTINGLDDIRLRVFESHGFEAGVLGGYAFGRDQDDGPLLAGLGDVDGGIVAGAFLGYRIGTALFDVSYHHIVSGDTGGFFRIGVSNRFEISQRLTAKVRAGATYASEEYMADYFGISAAQSASSLARLAAFDTEAGFKDVNVYLGATYKIDTRWTLKGGVGYKRLIGDAADSPIVESEDQFSATFGATYRFSLTR